MRPRSTTRIAAVLALAASCGAFEAPPATVAEYVSANATQGVPFEGIYEGERHTLFVGELVDGRYFVGLGVASGEPPLPVMAEGDGDRLVLDEPLEGVEVLHRCRLDGADVLLAQPGTRIEGGRPQGLVLERIGDLPEPGEADFKAGGYSPGPEDEIEPKRRVPGESGGHGDA